MCDEHVHIPYVCPNYGFEADDTHCDKCDGIVLWMSDGPGCTGCGMIIS